MFKTLPFRIIFLPVFLMCLLILDACKSSEFSDIFYRCAPDCADYESPVPIEEVKDAFTQVISTIVVDKSSLTGRWVMLSASRYTVTEQTYKSFTDLLFTKSMVFTEVGNEVHVSDCYNTEVYPLNESGFTIPKNSVFFSSLYFENKNPIIVNKKSNKLLNANWTFTTPQNTQSSVEVDMYKVNNSDNATAVLGTVNGVDDIYCYSYLHVFTSGEQFLGNQWFPGEYEIKEMLLKVDSASGDENIALSSKVTNSSTSEYKIIFNQNIEFAEYECFGENNMENASEDHLSFLGSFNITSLDVGCSKGLGESTFSFLIQ